MKYPFFFVSKFFNYLEFKHWIHHGIENHKKILAVIFSKILNNSESWKIVIICLKYYSNYLKQKNKHWPYGKCQAGQTEGLTPVYISISCNLSRNCLKLFFYKAMDVYGTPLKFLDISVYCWWMCVNTQVQVRTNYNNYKRSGHKMYFEKWLLPNTFFVPFWQTTACNRQFSLNL